MGMLYQLSYIGIIPIDIGTCAVDGARTRNLSRDRGVL
jgi:hypothetical protein